jgi:ABC-type uncharacterized transport system permease subunit
MGDLSALLGATPAVFVGLTVVLVGGAAVLAGRAIAGNWKPAWHVVAACLGLALADRFLIYALFDGELLSLWGFLLHFAVLLGLGLASWRIAQVGKMVGQYPWRYERTSPFVYAEIKDG